MPGDREWRPGDFAEVAGGGMPIELLRTNGRGLWQCARLFPKPGGKVLVVVDEALMHPFVADEPEDTNAG